MARKKREPGGRGPKRRLQKPLPENLPDRRWPGELELMEECLRAVPDFIKRHKQDDPAKEELTVPVASGQLRLVLSWVVEDVV